jgi:hypothetical protein
MPPKTEHPLHPDDLDDDANLTNMIGADRSLDIGDLDVSPMILLNDLGPARVVPEPVLEADITNNEPSPIERAVRRALAAGEEYEIE